MRKVLLLAIPAAALAVAASALGQSERASGPAKSGVKAAAQIACGNSRTIGLMAPITGPAASLGQPQVHWADYYLKTYNAKHKAKYRFVKEDTQLGAANGTAEALKGAQALASNTRVLGVVGPAGSNEVRATTSALKGSGLGFVSGSATNTQITLDGARTNYFYRTVPPDSSQSKSVTAYMVSKLKVKRVYIIDDQEAYSTGLADEVQSQLRAKGVSVSRDGVSQQESDFSSLIAKIARNTQLVYLPWQLPPKAQAFGRQMKSSGRGSIKLMGSDGLFDAAFSGLGSHVYDSFFPLNTKSKIVKTYQKGHKGKGEFFGAPSYAATQVVVEAVDRACKNGTATRAEVRAQIKKTNIPAKRSLLGLPIKFDRHGDMIKRPFGIYHSVKGVFVRVA